VYITPALFEFLTDLSTNNNRPWFADNKHRYENHIKKPLLQFIRDFAPLLSPISQHCRAEPKWGQSLFKIHRDTRFTKDKTPFKTFVGIRFRHTAGTEREAPAFYLHLSLDECFAAAGIWKPSTQTLNMIRQAIVDDPSHWIDLKESLRPEFELWNFGDNLKVNPRGFGYHPDCSEDIRRKHFSIHTPLSHELVLHPYFPGELATLYHRGAPMMRFLSEALGLPW